MICPKCKSEISDTALRCPICNTKVKMFCPSCHSLIKFGLKTCNVCQNEILKKCKNCGAVNLAGENICRKCKKPINILMADTKPKSLQQQPIAPKPEPIKKIQEVQKTTPVQKDKTVAKNEDVEITSNSENTKEEKLNINPAEIFEMNISDSVDIASADKSIPQQEEIHTKFYEQQEAGDRLYSALKDDKKYIIAISGQDGYGKSTIIKNLIPNLNKDNINVLYCECSANTQLSPFGALQAIFRKYLSLPDFYANYDIFEKNFKPVIANAFPFLSKSELSYLCNVLYPTDEAFYENILVNQNNTYEILDKIIVNISEIYPLIIVIDSFELIDAGSYKYLMSLIKKGIINSQVKLLVSYKENIKVQSYLNFISEDENIYENIFLKSLSNENFDNLVKFFLNGSNPLPDSIKKQIIKNSQYNAGYIEQSIFYLNDLNAFVVQDKNVTFSTDAYDTIIPENYEKLVTTRLNNLKTGSVELYEFLINASILGTMFNVQIIQSIMNLPDETTNKMVNFLINSGYIMPYQNTDFAFRNTRFWKYVYDVAKGDNKFIEYNRKMHMLLSGIEYYNLPIKALFAQNIDENFMAFNLWTQNIKVAAAVGDIDLYVLSQKQCLKLLNDFAHTNGDYIKNNIHERVGKLIYKSNPIEATDFLTNAMAIYHQKGDTLKAIELSGFLLKSQNLEGNALSTIEIVDNVLRILPTSGYDLEKALIKAKKINALLKIGNYEELINLVKNEIVPVLEVNLAKNIQNKRYSHELLFETWLRSAICEANAYSYQGNDKSLDVINTIEEVLRANDKSNVNNHKLEIEIAKAIGYTVKGQIDFSDEILKTIDFSSKDLSEQEISLANLIRVVNKLLRFDFVNIRDDLFEAATFANNCNDNVLKNIFKTLLAKLIKEDGNAQKAMDIYNEQVTYFAGEKISAGAFLCWYFMTELYLLTEGPNKALEVAMKSLEIAKNPKISNFNFMIMFKKIIAEIYLIKRDFEAAKMYIEKALLMARKFGLDYFVMILYHLYGKYFEEIITSKTSQDTVNVQNSLKMYEKSTDIAKELNLEKYILDNENAKKSLQVFCQLNNIKVD